MQATPDAADAAAVPPESALRRQAKRFVGLVRRHPAVSVVLGLYLAWTAWFVWAWMVPDLDGDRHVMLFDDAMITMRYAANLADGHGAVWNVGERVEGFSNPTMLVVMTAVQFFASGEQASLGVQLLGIVTMVALAVTSWQVALRLGEPGPWLQPHLPVVGVASALAFYPLSEWTLRGMEPGLFALGIAWFLLGGLRHKDDPRTWGRVMAGSAAVIALTRPEGLVIAGLLFLWFLQRNRLQGTGDLRLVARLAWPTLAALVAFEAIRFAYYGEWLPNTYTLKVAGIPLGTRLANGWAYSVHQVPFVLPIAFALLLCGRRLLHPDILVGPALFGALFAMQVWVGGDFVVRWRMVAAAVPTLLLSTAIGLSGVPWLLKATADVDAKQVRRVALVLGLAFVVAFNAPFRANIAADHDTPAWFLAQNGVAKAELINDLLYPTATIAVFAAGAIPYQTGMPALDLLGKADAHIAATPPHYDGVPLNVGLSQSMTYWPGHNKYDLNHSILQKEPVLAEGLAWPPTVKGVFQGDNVHLAAVGKYVPVCYGDVVLYLRAYSPFVNWTRVFDYGDKYPCTA